MKFDNYLLKQEECSFIPYYEDLHRIADVFQKNFIDFPYNMCNLTARIVYQKIGLNEIAGLVLDPLTDKVLNSDRMMHAWNHDPNLNLNLCLTLSQYDKETPTVANF